ncbi:cellulose biosynthesis cyclic di-GMP-binding regulatory protein BcsB [Paraburkholderia sp. UCT31]|uniref:cellulose biosynthesis cyclic di-GMP-binding regulatory protein BcsB n=1 Tax=Paraburkholderia sp. UCT31 TaxID=2615209 RepID=UPI0016563C74|nr:cellulose biosynthesis cyclic di-GMP-binding regulatory protein BcsB [Paraburkholderia sp. UCT31]MBC8739780.1 cellulose biosynthesis cyclic di-GMP-binding regulatory protein BcsB [Paraburkholderia sp. UCT31]
MAKWIIGATVALLLTTAASPLMAQTATRPFSALLSAGDAAAAAHALTLELSPREVLSGVHLRVTPAAAVPADSQYIVWVNGEPATEVKAERTRVQTVALPPHAFVPGVNSVQLALVPKSASLSGDPARAYLAAVDDAHSSVTLDFAGLRENNAPTLAQLPVAFDRRAWLPRAVTVVTGRNSDSEAQLRAAALVLQGIAARMPQVDVTAHYRNGAATVEKNADRTSWAIAQKVVQAGDVLLVGTRKTLAPYLPAAVATGIAGPFLGVYPANNGKSVVVVVSGDSDLDVVRAAHAFVDSGFVFPGTATTSVDASAVVHVPDDRLAVSLTEPNPSLKAAALNFVAIKARMTGRVTDVDFRFNVKGSPSGLILGRDLSIDPAIRRGLPVYPPLRTGQAVSLPSSAGSVQVVALLGQDETAVARSVSMLRAPGAWQLFTHEAALFDTRDDKATPLAVTKRSLVGRMRLMLADPKVFWTLLSTLLLLAFWSTNATLAAQEARRLSSGTL